MSGLQCGMKNETVPVSLGCLHKPVDDLFKLFSAAGFWISLYRLVCRVKLPTRKFSWITTFFRDLHLKIAWLARNTHTTCIGCDITLHSAHVKTYQVLSEMDFCQNRGAAYKVRPDVALTYTVAS